MIRVECPGLIVRSEANLREHWAKRNKRKNAQQASLWLYLAGCERKKMNLPAVIIFTRCGGRKMDSDNLAGAFKACRDCLAKWLGMDDGDERLTWLYEQSVGGEAGVVVTIEEML